MRHDVWVKVWEGNRQDLTPIRVVTTPISLPPSQRMMTRPTRQKIGAALQEGAMGSSERIVSAIPLHQ